ncbi:hypothetical protein NPIL_971 [Nephila pilipes]|uniref:Uncharacterized protein n=1 Tax=Nephila pilipes TaxID=299642 RepID=A0A8X6NMX4_NEPPI|nr:hypothetical protein NPIL_971 [Nephila pilipes]
MEKVYHRRSFQVRPLQSLDVVLGPPWLQEHDRKNKDPIISTNMEETEKQLTAPSLRYPIQRVPNSNEYTLWRFLEERHLLLGRGDINLDIIETGMFEVSIATSNGSGYGLRYYQRLFYSDMVLAKCLSWADIFLPNREYIIHGESGQISVWGQLK